ncbi:hypothetical protein AB0G71_14810 [Streptomyces sp. NPDC020403]|uniref:hypothetical protein n=1 Tax=unclassified Streptomyces TaxID=2593676 RepID=UPI0033E4E656
MDHSRFRLLPARDVTAFVLRAERFGMTRVGGRIEDGRIAHCQVGLAFGFRLDETA